MKVQVCKNCSKEYPRGGGFHLNMCKSCYDKKYYKEHREYKKERSKKWQKAHKELHRKYSRKWVKRNSEKVKENYIKWKRENKEYVRRRDLEYQKERRRVNPKYGLDRNIATAIGRGLKGKKAGRHWEDLVGYTIENLIKHLEKQFEPWMSWENYGKWHIDHIIPKSHFKYQTAEDPEFKKCWALENLQPLEKIANIRKGNR